jgi:hypothetical protein
MTATTMAQARALIAARNPLAARMQAVLAPAGHAYGTSVRAGLFIPELLDMRGRVARVVWQGTPSPDRETAIAACEAHSARGAH